MTTIERLQKYFKENDEWHDDNWTTPGNENPYPPKIHTAIIRYLMMKYKVTTSYYDRNGKLVIEVADEDILWDSTMNAWFDCTTLDGCIDLMKYWVRCYYQDYESGEAYTDKVTVLIEPRQTNK